MRKLSPNRLGIAIGATAGIFYAMCWTLMEVIPLETVVWFFNSLMHGADMTTIMRDSVPLSQSLVGILSTLFGGWIFGGLTAWFYNLLPGHNSLTSNP